MNRLIIIISSLFFVVFILLISSRKRPQERVPVSEGDADLILSQISFVQTRNNLKDWELTAKEAEFHEEDQTAFLKTISVVMESEHGAPLTLTGDRGKIDSGGKTFSVQSGHSPVTVHLSNGYTIQTSSLSWSSEERVIQTDDPVEISGAGVAIRGEGMRIIVDRSEVTLMRNVHAKMD